MRLIDLFESDGLPDLMHFASDEKFIKSVIDDYLRDNEGDSILYAWRHSLGLDHYDNSITPDTDGFMDFAYEWIGDRVGEVAIEMQHRFRSGFCIAYRCITVPEGWQFNPTTQHPGIYWTWDSQTAVAHWGDYRQHSKHAYLTANLSAEQVDWPVTIHVNSHPGYWDEKEIRIIKDTPVNVTNVVIK